MGTYSQSIKTEEEWAFGEVERALHKGIQLRVGILTSIHFLFILLSSYTYANTSSRVPRSPLFFVLLITREPQVPPINI